MRPKHGSIRHVNPKTQRSLTASASIPQTALQIKQADCFANQTYAQHCCTHTGMPGLQRDRTDTRIAPAWPRWHTLFVATARAHSRTATPGQPIPICRKERKSGRMDAVLNDNFKYESLPAWKGQWPCLQGNKHAHTCRVLFTPFKWRPVFARKISQNALHWCTPLCVSSVRAATYFIILSCTP